jgi:hypothetical protein
MQYLHLRSENQEIFFCLINFEKRMISLSDDYLKSSFKGKNKQKDSKFQSIEQIFLLKDKINQLFLIIIYYDCLENKYNFS